MEFGRKSPGKILQNPLNAARFSCGAEVTACRCEFEPRDAPVSVCDRTLLQRDTCWEAWLRTAEERGGWEMNCDASLAHGGRDRIQQLVQCSPPPPQPPALSATTDKAGKGTWQVEGVEVLASAQRRGLELLIKRTVSQRGLRGSRQSCTRTVWSLSVYACERVCVKCPYAS